MISAGFFIYDFFIFNDDHKIETRQKSCFYLDLLKIIIYFCGTILNNNLKK